MGRSPRVVASNLTAALLAAAIAAGISGAVSAGLTVASAPAAGAQVEGACPTSDGVTVVVDFGALGGGVQVGCARGPQATGLTALTNAGFAWNGTTRFPTFVCRILDKPADANCYDAAPVNATWAYWTAPAGGEWRYSSVGAAGGATASPGTVQGWSWSTGKNVPPSIAPPRVSVPDTAAPPAPTVAPAPAPSPAQPSPPAGGSAAMGGGVAAPATPATPGPAGGSSATAGGSAQPQPDPAVPDPGALGATPSDAAVSDAAPSDAAETDAGVQDADVEVLGAVTEAPEADVAAGVVTVAEESTAPIGTIVGAATIAAGAAVAGLVARRRRRI